MYGSTLSEKKSYYVNVRNGRHELPQCVSGRRGLPQLELMPRGALERATSLPQLYTVYAAAVTSPNVYAAAVASPNLNSCRRDLVKL